MEELTISGRAIGPAHSPYVIAEIGATAVRLAHYQHKQHVYDLTDRLGFVVWAEIPNIDSVKATPGAYPSKLQSSFDCLLERRE